MSPARSPPYNPRVPRIRLSRLSRLARRAAIVLIAGLFAAVLVAPRMDAEEEWRTTAEVNVRYEIEARVLEGKGDDDRLRIGGEQLVVWTNTSDEPVSVAYLHLYANAFRNTRSSFLREKAFEGWSPPDDMQYGGIEIRRLSRVGFPGELELSYVSADDANPADRTVARVQLDPAIAPGGQLALKMKFTTTLPTIVARMGHKDDFIMAAQWYPKLGRFVGTQSTMRGVREGWYCHQFHRSTEFFADYADYLVTLHVPSGTVTGATGTRVSDETDEVDFIRTETWEAKSVVDFAWTSSPRYERHVREIRPLRAAAGLAPMDDPVRKELIRVAALRGVDPESIDIPGVWVTLLIQPEHAAQVDRHFEAARVALGMFGIWFGAYPYDRLTIVDPAHGARAAGGMEYPQLVTAGTRNAAPERTLRPEGVIVHEIGHQWFMNLLATNEAEEAWLDEGLNTYFTTRALHLAYGPPIGEHRLLGVPFLVTPFFEFPGLGAGWPEWIDLPEWAHPPDLDIFTAWRDLPPLTMLPTQRYRKDPMARRRASYVRRAGWDEMVKPGWEFVDRSSYGVNAYSRPLLLLATLRRTLHWRLGADEGERAFDAGMLRYARDWRFRHPTTADFLAAFSDGAGFDVRPIVAALTQTAGALDYAVESIKPLEEPELAGWVERDGETVLVHEDGESGERRRGRDEPRTAVVVRRRGEVVVPIRLQVTRDSGPADEVSWTTVEWDGEERWKRFVFEGEIVAARIHPDAEYLQDVDRRNDSRVVEPTTRPGVKWGVRFMLWLENAALSYGRFL